MGAILKSQLPFWVLMVCFCILISGLSLTPAQAICCHVEPLDGARYNKSANREQCCTVGTITERARKDGSVAYLAQITVKREGRIVHRENQTFDSRKRAAGWIGRREDELSQPGAIEPVNDPQLLEVIDKYLATSRKAIGKTKAQVLDAWKAHALAKRRCSTITSADIVQAAQGLLQGGRKPQTVLNYLSHLSSIFAIARPAWGHPLSHQAMLDAMAVTKRLGVTSKSGERDRRPTLDELNRILAHFQFVRARRPATAPMVDIVLFAIFSTRRQEEISRITWEDLEHEHGRVMVRDMKHPGDKVGNDQWVDLVPEAMAVVLRQPRAGERIFPYTTDAISAAFTRACKFLGIKDLHFHDMRHEGISRLFELGWGIPQVACVSGHRSWQSLKRYAHIRKMGDKYAGWAWLPQKEGPH